MPLDMTPIMIADILAVRIVIISIGRTTVDALYLMWLKWQSCAVTPTRRARRALPKLT